MVPAWLLIPAFFLGAFIGMVLMCIVAGKDKHDNFDE